ncbi:transferase family domain-containing protein [Trichoderma evansii]
MANAQTSERLTPLDVIMPRTYINVFLSFHTTKSSSSLLQILNRGLGDLCIQVPWLSGHVFLASPPEIRSDSAADTTVMLVDKGSISVSYEEFCLGGMLPTVIPPALWPEVSNPADEHSEVGEPVFRASFFRFSDAQGVGLCVSMHHNTVDAYGIAEVIKMWARNIGHSGYVTSVDVGERVARLKQGLSPNLQMVSSKDLDSLFASHPEYSRDPPGMPLEFSPCTCKMFTIPMTEVEATKHQLREYMTSFPSTNAVICALVWSSITRVRAKRNPALLQEICQLVSAVDGRRRVNEQFSESKNPYLGNFVLYAMASLSAQELGVFFEQPSSQALAKICTVISDSQSSTHINSQHISEVVSLVEHLEYSIYPGWDLFKSRDLTISSWADLDFYNMEFGTELGSPDCVRIPYTEADGVCLILPRKKFAANGNLFKEVVEIMVMLREDDMDCLKNNWKEFCP